VFLVCSGSSRDGDRYILPEVLPEAAWIVGEYSHLIPEALVGGTDGDDEALLAIQSKLVIPVQRHSFDGLTYLVGELVKKQQSTRWNTRKHYLRVQYIYDNLNPIL
jgi:hypothetical protein